MKINVFPRIYFAAHTGTQEETALLRTHRIISLNSSSGSTAMPPFSNLRESNLLCLTVDDIVWTIRGMVLFNMEHAQKIWNFVENNQLPLMVHCNAGISRSGATISGGMLFGLSRENAVKFSFLMSVPAIIGANICNLPEAFSVAVPARELGFYAVGMLTALVSGFGAMKFLSYISAKEKFGFFAYYCITIGLAVFFFC